MLLDAMVSGSTPQAERAELVFLVGGDADSLKRAEPVFKTLGSTIRHAGPVGCGALAKLATNTLMGVQLAALAELIGMLKSQQVDAKQILDAVSATAMWNPHPRRRIDADGQLRDSVPGAAPRKGPGLHCANWGRRSIDANRKRCTKHFP
jgi:3-hydroxyisobutyrate dehydrogenase-like beta-hydroxyacid dehydrogenase